MKRLSFIFCLTAVSTFLWAAKANVRPFMVTQSDGSQLTVTLHGDEYYSWYSTLDGVILSRSGNDFYISNISENGIISPTTQLAHEYSYRSVAEQALIARQDKATFFSEVSDARRSTMRREQLGSSVNPAYFPNTGSPTAIVILVNYKDIKFTVSDPQKVFNQYLNGDQQVDYGHREDLNYGSVKKYFHDMSFGKFTPYFEVIEPVTLSNDMSYYGYNSDSKKDVNCDKMIKEACLLASSKIDFSDPKYDSNNDGDIDLVYVIYAGYGESNGADASTIWPRSGTGNFGSYDGKNIRRYGVNNELNANPYLTTGIFASPKINGIGLFCHEFSHCLGLPDLYPYSIAAQIDNQAMEYWSVMDGGEYVYYGYYPTSYTAWEREVLGWYSITSLTENANDIRVTPVNDGGKSYKMVNDSDPTEYIVMENIQKRGWNEFLPGHGLILYHVKWPNKTVNFTDHPNEIPGKPGFALIPADGILISSYNDDQASEYQASHKGDPFPGINGITELTYTQNLPNYSWYSNGPMINKSLKNITEETGSGLISFDYVHDTTITSIDDAVISDTVTSKGKRIYTIDGTYIGSDFSKISNGLFVVDGKKIIKK